MKSTDRYSRQFEDTLHAISEKGITTMEALCEPANAALHERLWIDIRNFISYCALCSKDRLDDKQEKKRGNGSYVDYLASRGVSVEDVREDVLIHVMSKFHLVLKQPVKRQKPYIYVMVNNRVVDHLRGLPPEDVQLISIHDTVKSDRVSQEDACEYQHLIPERITPELVCLAKDAVLEENRRLASHPEENFVYLCSKYLKLKPAQISASLLRCDADRAYANVISYVCGEYEIPLKAVRKLTDGYPISAEKLHLPTGDKKQVSAQISKLLYRAKTRLPESD